MSKLLVSDKIKDGILKIDMRDYEREHNNIKKQKLDKLDPEYEYKCKVIDNRHCMVSGLRYFEEFKKILTCELDAVPSHIIVKDIFEYNKITETLSIDVWTFDGHIYEILRDINTYWGKISKFYLKSIDITVNFDKIMEIVGSTLIEYKSLNYYCEYTIPTKQCDKITSLQIEYCDESIIDFLKMFPNLKKLILHKKMYITMYNDHTNEMMEYDDKVDDILNNKINAYISNTYGTSLDLYLLE